MTAFEGLTDIWEFLQLDEHLSERYIEKREEVRNLMQELKPTFIKAMNTTEFPWEVIPKIRALNIAGIELGEHGGPGFNMIEGGNLSMELAKVDASFATFFGVHSIVVLLLSRLANEEQMKKWIPHCA